MKKTWYVLALAFVAFTSCSDDNGTLSPSGNDVDYFEIKPSTTGVDGVIYDVYKTYGVSMFYNDTIGADDEGVDGFGQNVVRYEILTPCYDMSSSVRTITYGLSHDEDEISSGVTLVRDKVLPLLCKDAYPRSFLFVDKLILNANKTAAEGRREGYVYDGLMTTVVGGLGDFSAFSDRESDSVATVIASAIWYSYLMQEDASGINDFGLVSFKAVDESIAQVYNVQVRKTGVSSLPYSSEGWSYYGFLTNNVDKSATKTTAGEYTIYYTPTLEQDVLSFIFAAMFYSPTEFEAMYGSKTGYEYLLDKYLIISDLLNKYKN